MMILVIKKYLHIIYSSKISLDILRFQKVSWRALSKRLFFADEKVRELMKDMIDDSSDSEDEMVYEEKDLCQDFRKYLKSRKN